MDYNRIGTVLTLITSGNNIYVSSDSNTLQIIESFTNTSFTNVMVSSVNKIRFLCHISIIDLLLLTVNSCWMIVILPEDKCNAKYITTGSFSDVTIRILLRSSRFN